MCLCVCLSSNAIPMIHSFSAFIWLTTGNKYSKQHGLIYPFFIGKIKQWLCDYSKIMEIINLLWYQYHIFAYRMNHRTVSHRREGVARISNFAAVHRRLAKNYCDMEILRRKNVIQIANKNTLVRQYLIAYMIGCTSSKLPRLTVFT